MSRNQHILRDNNRPGPKKISAEQIGQVRRGNTQTHCTRLQKFSLHHDKLFTPIAFPPMHVSARQNVGFPESRLGARARFRMYCVLQLPSGDNSYYCTVEIMQPRLLQLAWEVLEMNIHDMKVVSRCTSLAKRATTNRYNTEVKSSTKYRMWFAVPLETEITCNNASLGPTRAARIPSRCPGP